MAGGEEAEVPAIVVVTAELEGEDEASSAVVPEVAPQENLVALRSLILQDCIQQQVSTLRQHLAAVLQQMAGKLLGYTSQATPQGRGRPLVKVSTYHLKAITGREAQMTGTFSKAHSPAAGTAGSPMQDTTRQLRTHLAHPCAKTTCFQYPMHI